jgi:F-type H+-transporting ATPase subunit epsilon
MKCDIVSARRTVWSGEVSMIIADGAAGELGITPRHAPLLTTLKPGAIRVVDGAGEERTFMIGGGILEVMPHLVTILVDHATRAVDFDEAAAKQAVADARRELETQAGKMEIADAQAMLAETIEQLRALEQWRKRVQHKK